MLGIPRKVWILSGVVFLLMVVIWLFQPPVFVDSFDPKNPVTFSEALLVNVLASWWLLFPPPLVVLGGGWIVQRLRKRNRTSS
jgi:hypothetical protein